MRKTTAFFLFFTSSLLLVAGLLASQSQPKVVNFKKLQEFLPKVELPWFTRLKPGGETTSAFGFSSSEAYVNYEKGSGDNIITVEVKIADTAGSPLGQLGTAFMGITADFENQTETGYQKSIKVQGFPGTETVNTSEDGKSAEVILFVGNRFSVELRGSGTSEVALLHKLLSDMKLADLAKLAQ